MFILQRDEMAKNLHIFISKRWYQNDYTNLQQLCLEVNKEQTLFNKSKSRSKFNLDSVTEITETDLNTMIEDYINQGNRDTVCVPNSETRKGRELVQKQGAQYNKKEISQCDKFKKIKVLTDKVASLMSNSDLPLEMCYEYLIGFIDRLDGFKNQKNTKKVAMKGRK